MSGTESLGLVLVLLFAALLMLSYDHQYVEFVKHINLKLHHTHACKHQKKGWVISVQCM